MKETNTTNELVKYMWIRFCFSVVHQTNYCKMCIGSVISTQFCQYRLLSYCSFTLKLINKAPRFHTFNVGFTLAAA